MGFPIHTEITVSKYALPSPLNAGFVMSVGEARGQVADYRLPLDDGREVHVREFQNDYTVHLDQVSAVRNPLGHLFTDAPHWIAVSLVGLLIVLLIFGGQEEE
jgi:hypothetical protein